MDVGVCGCVARGGNNNNTVFLILEEGFFFMIQALKASEGYYLLQTRPVRLIVPLHQEVKKLIALPVFFLFFFWKYVRLWNQLRPSLPSFLYLSIKGERRF